MFIVVAGNKVTYITSKASTLPDNPNKASSLMKGVYEYSSHHHNFQYPGMRYNPDGNLDTLDEQMPAILSNGSTGTATRINIHTAGNSPSSTWSEGCQIVHYDDYIRFGQAVGFMPSEAPQAKSYRDVTKQNAYFFKNNPLDALYVLDRTFMREGQRRIFHYN